MAKLDLEEVQQTIVQIYSLREAEANKPNPDVMKLAEFDRDISGLTAAYDAKQPAPIASNDTKELETLAETDPVAMGMAFIQGVNKGAIDTTLDLVPNVGNVLIGSLNYIARQSGVDFQIPEAAKISDVVDAVSNSTLGVKPFESQRAQIEGEVFTNPYTEGYDVGTVGDTALERVAGVTGEVVGGGAALSPLLQKTIPYAAQALPKVIGTEIKQGTGAGLALGTTKEYTDNPLLQLGAAILGGTTTELATLPFSAYGKAQGVVQQGLKETFTEEGMKVAAERRVSNALTANTAEPSVAIQNIKKNRLVVDEVIPEGRPSTIGLSEDPYLDSALQQLTKNSPRIGTIIADAADVNTQALVRVLEDSAPTTVTPKQLIDVEAASVAAINKQADDAILGLRSNMEAAADLAKAKLDELESNPNPDFRIEAESNALVNATKVAFEKAKAVQTKLWDAVERTEPLDLKPLRQELLMLKKDMEKRIIDPIDIPTGVLSQVTKLGNKDNNNFAALEEFRSYILRSQREANAAGKGSLSNTYGEIERKIANYIDTAGTSPQYREAAAYTRSYRDMYFQGTLGRVLQNNRDGSPRIEPDAALETVLSPKGKGSAEVKRFVAASQGRPTEFSVDGKAPQAGTPIPASAGIDAPIQVALRDMFYDVKDKAKFLKDYGPTFRLFPNLSRDLTKITDEIKVTTEQVAGLEGRFATSLDESKVKATALLGEDPARVIAKLKTLSPQEAINLVNVMKKQGVEDGLQALVQAEFIKQMKISNREGYQSGLKALDPILTAQSDPAMRILFENVLTVPQQQALRKVDEVARIVLNNKGKDTGTTVKLKQSPFARVISSWVGSKVASITGSKSNLILTSRIMGAIDGVTGTLNSAQASTVLQRAAVDPDYLASLIKLPTAKTIDGFEGNLRGYLYAVGLDVTEEEKEKARKLANQ